MSSYASNVTPALAILNTFCVLLPVVAFLSPITVFSPAFCNGRGNTDDADVTTTSTSTHRDDIKIQMPPLAVTSQTLQCGLFAIYAFDLDMTTLLIPNAIGFLLGLLWSVLYPFRTTEGYRFQWQWQFGLTVVVIVAGGVITFSFGNPYFASSVGAVVGVVMCAYPLPVMWAAVETRNVALLGSMYMNLAMFLCCGSWVIHSSPLVEFDAFVLTSNSAGVVVQGGALVIRVYLYQKYKYDVISSEVQNITNQSPLV